MKQIYAACFSGLVLILYPSIGSSASGKLASCHIASDETLSILIATPTWAASPIAPSVITEVRFIGFNGATLARWMKVAIRPMGKGRVFAVPSLLPTSDMQDQILGADYAEVTINGVVNRCDVREVWLWAFLEQDEGPSFFSGTCPDCVHPFVCYCLEAMYAADVSDLAYCPVSEDGVDCNALQVLIE